MIHHHFSGKSLDTLKKEYRRIIASHRCSVTEEDYSRLESRLPWIHELARIENRAVSLYDLNRRTFILKVDSHIDLLGFNAKDVDINDIGKYHAMIHVDDLPFMYDSEIQMYHFLRGIPGNGKKDYKLVYDFRVRNRDGGYIRFLHQLCPFELDTRGNSWILLIISDVLSSYPENGEPLRFIMNTGTRKVHLFHRDMKIASDLLTRREKEVLDLVSQGYSSDDIAGRLCVSVHTVNNHRQNILVKTNTRNLVQAITFARLIGLL
ncbi:MAG: helix-turn-helix transcriptional regulator [Spirochaetales bacterium]|nr:helix-turn-helix transcriptional regulator [Spirochaetales bacterium]